jgi:hypothetical protein
MAGYSSHHRGLHYRPAADAKDRRAPSDYSAVIWTGLELLLLALFAWLWLQRPAAEEPLPSSAPPAPTQSVLTQPVLTQAVPTPTSLPAAAAGDTRLVRP